MYKIDKDYSVRTAQFSFLGTFNPNNHALKESVFLASPSLYNSCYRDGCNDIKLDKLLKYYKRGCTRTTPFGTLAAVGINNSKPDKYVSLRPDGVWLRKIKGIVLKEISNTFCFKVRWNQSIQVFGDIAIKTNLRDDKGKSITSTINYSEATNIIQEITKEKFVNFQNLINLFTERYPRNIDISIIVNYINQLLKKGYLITDMDCIDKNDNWNDFICSLTSYSLNKDLTIINKLKKLDYTINSFNQKSRYLTPSERILRYDEIKKEMKQIYDHDRLIQVDCYFNPVISQNIDTNENDILQNLLNHHDQLNKELTLMRNNELKSLLVEKYGYSMVSLRQVLEDFSLDKLLEKMSEFKEETIYLEKINSYLSMCEYKKNSCNLENFSFSYGLEKDSYKEINTYPDVELAVSITENNKDELEYSVSPLIGSLGRDRINGRFLHHLEEKPKKIEEEKIMTIEILAQPSDSIVENVMQSALTANFVFEWDKYMKTETEIKKIDFSDIYLVLDNKMYFYSIEHKKEINFVINNSVNFKLFDKLIQFLLYFSLTNYASPFSVIEGFDRVSRKRIHTPKCVFGKNIIVSPERWNLNGFIKKEATKDFDIFKKEVSDFSLNYDVGRFIGIEDEDKRLVIDTYNDEELNLLFLEFKKKEDIIICNVDYLFDKSITADIKGRPLLNEFIFEFNSKINFEDDINLDAYEISKSRVCSPLKGEWTNFNIYYYPQDISDKILLKINEFMYENSISQFFFIRYIDERGIHFRFRIKSTTNDILSFIDFLNILKKENLIREYILCDYVRELERYGGIKFSDKIENFFVEESKLVLNILKIIDERKISLTKFELGIIGIAEIILNSQIYQKENLDVLRSTNDRKLFKKEYRSYKQNVLNTFLSVNSNKEHDIYDLFEYRKNAFDKFWDEINREKTKKFKENFLKSLVHMYHNRLFGIDKKNEDQLTIISGHFVYDYNQYVANNNKKG